MYAYMDAHISSSLPPLGRSDHNMGHLKPCYVPLVKRKPTTTRTVRRWSEEEALQGCFEITDIHKLLCGLQCPCSDCNLLH